MDDEAYDAMDDDYAPRKVTLKHDLFALSSTESSNFRGLH